MDGEARDDSLRRACLSRRASVSSEYETAADCGLHRAALTQRRLGTIDRPNEAMITRNIHAALYTSRSSCICLQQTRATRAASLHQPLSP
jgi:hypothetical protein